jgi:cytochrome c-type biogenesis protein CcmH
MGAPGYGDQALSDRLAQADETRKNRPSQQEAESRLPPALPRNDLSPDYQDLMTKLRLAVAERPNDLQGQRLLARNEAALGNHIAARQAQQRVVDILGDQAQPADLTDLADLMILAAGGFVSPEAESILLGFLSQDPKNPVARYYMGLMFAQVGRPDAPFRAWSALLNEGPADAPWIRPIRGQIMEAARRAGVQYELPPLDTEDAPASNGPDADQVRAAQEMSDAERQEMIRGMVSGLAERLATDGGPPEDWARLITAYGVLGELAQAQAVYKEALDVFANSPDALAQIEASAENAGLRQ